MPAYDNLDSLDSIEDIKLRNLLRKVSQLTGPADDAHKQVETLFKEALGLDHTDSSVARDTARGEADPTDGTTNYIMATSGQAGSFDIKTSTQSETWDGGALIRVGEFKPGEEYPFRAVLAPNTSPMLLTFTIGTTDLPLAL
ncbi:hypothetical protein RhiJN_12599 [Ceratobasidium sp. AG-Ba]|nr:hypothetical protein RhiJN_12599 [Ceratobasidium sp. AG-Ba]